MYCSWHQFEGRQSGKMLLLWIDPETHLGRTTQKTLELMKTGAVVDPLSSKIRSFETFKARFWRLSEGVLREQKMLKGHLP